MILIAENEHEDQLVPRLVTLLQDLRVDACGFQRGDAIAPIFWSVDDFSLELPFIKGLPKDEMSAILSELEPELLKAMIIAGFDVIENSVKHAKGALVHKHHRQQLQ